MVQAAVVGMDGSGGGVGCVQAQGGDRASDIVDKERGESETAEGMEQIVSQRFSDAGSYRSTADLHA